MHLTHGIPCSIGTRCSLSDDKPVSDFCLNEACKLQMRLNSLSEEGGRRHKSDASSDHVSLLKFEICGASEVNLYRLYPAVSPST